MNDFYDFFWPFLSFCSLNSPSPDLHQGPWTCYITSVWNTVLCHYVTCSFLWVEFGAHITSLEGPLQILPRKVPMAQLFLVILTCFISCRVLIASWIVNAICLRYHYLSLHAGISASVELFSLICIVEQCLAHAGSLIFVDWNKHGKFSNLLKMT